MSVLKPINFYSKEDIEQQAYSIFMKMKAQNYPFKWPFIAGQIVDFLELRTDRKKVMVSNDGGRIVGMILPKQRQIILNDDPEFRDEFEQFTIAHEIGHWVLHVNQDEADGHVKQMELDLGINQNEPQSSQSFLCRNVNDKLYRVNGNYSQSDKIEWQADYFAGCLLMPRYKLEEVCCKKDLTKWQNLYAIREDLGVTISSLTTRLQHLGWITIPQGSKQIYLGKPRSSDQRGLF